MEPPESHAPVAAVEIVALGDLAAPSPVDLAARLSRHVAVPCRLGAARPDARLPRLPGRDQLDAAALLASLADGAGPRATPSLRLGLTRLDLGLAVFSFVFGLAHTDGRRAAVVSLARLDPRFYGLPSDPETTERRALGEMLHELGHVAGRPHCRAPDCVMRFAANVELADARGARFCPACRAALPAWLRAPAWP